MRIAVLGAGAVGSGYGGLLARAGAEVVLVDVWAEHVEAIRRDGLVLEGLAEAAGDGAAERAIRVEASTDPAAVAGAGAVLVLTKATATAQAAESIAPHLGADAIAVTLQNGLGNDAALAAVLGAERVVAGSTTLGAEVQGPGRVRIAPSAAAGRSLTSLAEPPAGTPARARVDALATALAAAGLPAEVLRDVGAVIWRKLALTASIGPFCAVARLTIADALADAASRAVVREMFDETVAAAAADGVALDADELWAHALATWKGVGPHPPSIAVDVEAGRPTEIDVLSGAVHRRAAAAGREAPVARLVAAVLGAPGRAQATT